MDNLGPDISEELKKRIQLVRRDMSGLLFHFTRAVSEPVKIEHASGSIEKLGTNAFSVLRKILSDGFLLGTSAWSYGIECICFTEAPIQEFNSIFNLVEIASARHERPRYEPYGIAVNKTWLFSQGGRPVIYSHPSEINQLPEEQKYRFVNYDPSNGIDYSWEREWRIRGKRLALDHDNTLVIVPSSDEAFEIVYEHSRIEPTIGFDMGEAFIENTYGRNPKWLAVSLDIFGFERMT